MHKTPAASMMIMSVSGLLLFNLQTMGIFSALDVPWEVRLSSKKKIERGEMAPPPPYYFHLDSAVNERGREKGAPRNHPEISSQKLAPILSADFPSRLLCKGQSTVLALFRRRILGQYSAAPCSPGPFVLLLIRWTVSRELIHRFARIA